MDASVVAPTTRVMTKMSLMRRVNLMKLGEQNVRGGW